MKRENKFLLMIFISALIIRIGAVLFYAGYLNPAKDALFYDRAALSILRGEGIRDLSGNTTAILPPVYPIFLSLIFALFGHDYTAVRLVQSVLSAMICIFIYLTTKTIFSEKAARLAAVVSVVYPAFIFFSYYGGPGFILTETIFIFFLSGLATYISHIETLKFSHCAAIALFSVLLILTRFGAVYFPILAAFYFFIKFKNYGRRLVKYLLVFFFSLCLAILPWTIRNYQISREFSFLLHDESTSSLQSLLELFPELGKKLEVDSDELSSAIHRGKGFAYLSEKWGIDKKAVSVEIRKRVGLELKSNFGKYVNAKFLLKGMKIFWSPYYISLIDGKLKLNFSFVFILPFAMAGIFYAFLKRNIKAVFLVTLIAALNFMHLFTVLCERYRLPIEQWLIIFGAAGFFVLEGIFTTKRKICIFYSVSALYFALNLVAYFNSDYTVGVLNNLIP